MRKTENQPIYDGDILKKKKKKKMAKYEIMTWLRMRVSSARAFMWSQFWMEHYENRLFKCIENFTTKN